MTLRDDQDFRASVLAEVLRAIMRVPGPATASAIVTAAIDALQRPEEECSAEIYAAIFLLVRHDLIRSNTGGRSQSTIAADTVLTASPALIGFAWAESLCGDYPA